MVFSTQRLKQCTEPGFVFKDIMFISVARSHKSTVYLCNLKPYCRLLDEADDKDWT